MIYRLGFAASRAQARVMVSHGHFLVNGQRADVHSFGVKVDDVITVKEKSKETVFFKNLREEAKVALCPHGWLAT